MEMQIEMGTETEPCIIITGYQPSAHQLKLSAHCPLPTDTTLNTLKTRKTLKTSKLSTGI